MSEEMVLKPQQKSPTADHSAQPTPPVLTGQPETSSESDAEEEEEQGGYELLPQSEEDESGHDQEREEEEVYTHISTQGVYIANHIRSRAARVLSLSMGNPLIGHSTP